MPLNRVYFFSKTYGTGVSLSRENYATGYKIGNEIMGQGVVWSEVYAKMSEMIEVLLCFTCF